MHKHKGFTLIELMIVIAIVGILTSVALPIYTTYIVQAKLSEGVGLLAGERRAAELFYIQNGLWPHEHHTAKRAVNSNYFNYMQIYSDAAFQAKKTVWIHLSIKPGVVPSVPEADSSQVLIMEGKDIGGGSIVWKCGRHPHVSANVLKLEYLPSTCAQVLAYP